MSQQYLVAVELVTHAGRREVLVKMELVTSAPEHFIDGWLVENRLPRLSQWQYDGQTGAPRSNVLSSLYMKNLKLGDNRLVITTHELVPVDPTTVL